MLRILVDNWWLLALRGALALAFAIVVFAAQTLGITWLLRAVALASVVEWFGLLAFCAGIFTIIAAIRGFSKESGWWLLLLDGMGACLAGVLALTLPDLTFIPLVRLIAGWALFVGGCELVMARKLRRHLPDEWFLGVAAAGSVAFGVFLFLAWPPEPHHLFTWLGSYALFSAVTMLGLALRLRKLRRLAHLTAKHASSSGISSQT